MPAQHLNPRIADRVTEANERVTQATAALAVAQNALATAETNASANPQNQALQATLRQAKQDVARAQEVVQFEESLLEQLLHPRWHQSLLGRINLAAALQYVIFATLAFVVLFYLMRGITGGPLGTSPRGVITFLIAVVTVGIALILVLATVVSESQDREKRFAQGKEVLTALLGVLGTIVGFYFGISHDEVKGLDFNPVVISREADGSVTLSTSVRGGKAPYSFEITFALSTIPSVKKESLDGKLNEVIAGNVKQDTDVSLLISVKDSQGITGSMEAKNAFRLKAADDLGVKKK